MRKLTGIAASFGITVSLASLMELITVAFPLSRQHRQSLPRNVAELSRLLTSGRGERREGYLSEPPLLSAYLHYFLPWNVYRLSRILDGLELPLRDGAGIIDLGSGPLTLAIALWMTRPELRSMALEFRCLDHSGPALEAGKTLFWALSGAGPGAGPWTIKTIRASLGAPIRGGRAALVAAVQVYNERYWDIPHRDTRALAAFARREAVRLSALVAPDGAVLVVEPGLPRCGEFITQLRNVLIEKGLRPRAPCPHCGTCPLPGGYSAEGGKRKWCHLGFDTQEAPAALQSRSVAAGLPKERAALSYLLAGGPSFGNHAPSLMSDTAMGAVPDTGSPAVPDTGSPSEFIIRVISDLFPLGPGERWGRYGCSDRGLILIVGKRSIIEEREPGSLFEAPAPEREARDPKSGALMVELL